MIDTIKNAVEYFVVLRDVYSEIFTETIDLKDICADFVASFSADPDGTVFATTFLGRVLSIYTVFIPVAAGLIGFLNDLFHFM